MKTIRIFLVDGEMSIKCSSFDIVNPIGEPMNNLYIYDLDSNNKKVLKGVFDLNKILGFIIED